MARGRTHAINTPCNALQPQSTVHMPAAWAGLGCACACAALCLQLLNRQADVSHALQLLEEHLTFDKDIKVVGWLGG